MAFAGKLRAARVKAGKSQTDLAQAAGVSPTVISAYEKGTYKPKMETLVKLAYALGVDVPDLQDAYDTNEPSTTGGTVAEILAKAKIDLAAAMGLPVEQVKLEFGVVA